MGVFRQAAAFSLPDGTRGYRNSGGRNRRQLNIASPCQLQRSIPEGLQPVNREEQIFTSPFRKPAEALTTVDCQESCEKIISDRVAAMEGLVKMFWQGRKVFLTGHTGFKGSWLSLWLETLGADVMGYALAPERQPNLFEAVDASRGMQSVIGDTRNLKALRISLLAHAPEIVIHLAAQPLVRRSYEDPTGTYATNVLGTANVLEAVRFAKSVRSVVVITTDKCYENKEWIWAYRENDALGGHDPYSSSKACAELVVSSFRDSFFHPRKYSDHRVAVASARAGNVIGGGDWSIDRLLPDIARSFSTGQTLRIRNPKAIRPWQHVLQAAARLFDARREAIRAWHEILRSLELWPTLL